MTVRIGGVGGERLRAAAEAVASAAIPGVGDVVASPGRLTLAYDPLAIAGIDQLREAVSLALRGAGAAAGGAADAHEIPVVYDGPDLERLCADRGIDRERFVDLHTGPDYLVEAIGFLPGFAYLAGLRQELATPRLATPRRIVPAGAVGIGGGQTGVYPFASPGGWNLVGRSAVRLFDPGRPRPALLGVGDRVRFVAAAGLPPAADPVEPPATQAAAAAITVIEPGLFTTVQDLGRPGHRASGVPLSGAADPVSLRLANLLVGNAETAAGLECTLLGPTLRFEREAVVALVGASFPGLAANVATRVAAGTVIRLGHASTGCRGALAVAGGIAVPRVLGSASTLVAAGLGGLAGRPLRAGDRLGLGDPGGPPPRAAVAQALRQLAAAAPGAAREDRGGVLRIVPGEQAAEIGRAAWSSPFTASSRSDRMGLRLEGPPLAMPAAAAGLPSVAVFPGTVQLPPDGRPIVLLADAQTIGGYPVLGQVIAADLPIAAQLRPGGIVRFEPVSLAEAHAALRASAAALAAAREETA